MHPVALMRQLHGTLAKSSVQDDGYLPSFPWWDPATAGATLYVPDCGAEDSGLAHTKWLLLWQDPTMGNWADTRRPAQMTWPVFREVVASVPLDASRLCTGKLFH